MERTVVMFVVLLGAVGCVMAFPSDGAPRRRETGEVDRSVEAVPTRVGQRRPEIIPLGIGFGLSGLGGFGGLGDRPYNRGSAPGESQEDDEESGSYFPGFLRPFSVDPMTNFMAQMAEMMAAMRRQMDEVLERLPKDDLDLDKGNTTSVTKVINGHVVTVNDTTITRDDDGVGSVVHIRVVDVHPTDGPVEDGKEPEGKPDTDNSTTSDKEADQGGKQSNEIPKVGSEVEDLNKA